MKYSFKDIVIDSRTGLNPRKNFILGNGENNYITIKDIYDGQIHITEKTDKVDNDAIQIIKKRSQIKVGDILFVSIGRIGETAIVTEKDDTWDVNESVFVFTINKEIITPEYFCMLFQSDAVQKYLTSNSSGSTFKSIKMNQLEKMVFDLPSLTVQESIISRISNVKHICSLRASELTQLDNLIKARFVELFGEPIANPMGWPVKRLKDLSVLITNGNTPKGGSENYVENGITFLRSQNVWRNRIELDDVAFIDEATHESMKKSSLHHDDILITKTGRINTENSSLGRAALFKGADDSANINGHVYLVRLDGSIVPEFVVTILTGEAYRKYIRKVCVGGIDKRQINVDQVEDFPIIIPPYEKQKAFAAFVAQVDKSKSVVQKALDEAQLLFDSLMQKYFG